MTVAELIAKYLENLPSSVHSNVLAFVQSLEDELARAHGQDERAWLADSLSRAMRGLEDEQSPYSLGDLKEVFS